MHHDRLHHHDQRGDRPEIDEEGVEIEPGQRADQNIGRVADQRRGAADVGGEHFGEQKRIGRDVEFLGDRERHRHDQEHRRDIVEERGEHRRGELQHQQDAGGARLDPLRRPDRQILEQPGPPRDRDQDHDAGEKADGIPVDALDRLVLIERADARSPPPRREAPPPRDCGGRR